MTSVEKVKAICKERKIPISKLEKDLGFGNGYVSQLRKGSFPDSRLYAIADYLGVPAESLLERKPLDVSAHTTPITLVARAGEKLSEEQQEVIYKFAKFTFPEAFDD